MLKLNSMRAKLIALLCAFIFLALATVGLAFVVVYGVQFVRIYYAPNFLKQSIPPAALQALQAAKTLQTSLVENHDPGDPNALMAISFSAEKEITDPADVKRLVTALIDGVENTTLPMACFKPRHAIKLVEGNTEYCFLICYECNRLEVHWGKPATSGTRAISREDLIFGGELAPIADLFSPEPPEQGAK